MACQCDICTLEDPDERQRATAERAAWAHTSSRTLEEAEEKRRWLEAHAGAHRVGGVPIGRPFPKGVSGNPKGAPVRVMTVRHLLKGHEETWAKSLIDDLTHSNGKIRALARVTYAAYRWGLPAKEVKVTGQKGKELSLTVTHDGDPDRLSAIVQVLARAGVFPPLLAASDAGAVIDAPTDEVHPAHPDATADRVPSP